MVLAYARVSTDKQDNINQQREIKEYCKMCSIKLDKYISVEMSSRKSLEKRRITELYNLLQEGDTLITAELSRLGRDMLEVITLVFDLMKKGVKIVFIRQPELSFLKESASKLLLSFYAYMAEHERELISIRTKAGLKIALEKGKKLGRPLGSNKSKFDKDIDKVKELLGKKMTMMSIWKLLYTDSGLSYDGFRWWCVKRGLTNQKKLTLDLVRRLRANGMPFNVIHRQIQSKDTYNDFINLCKAEGIE